MNITVERILLGVLTLVVIFLTLTVFQYRVELEHIISVLILVGAAWLLYDFYVHYKTATGNVFQRAWTAMRFSETIVATRLQYLVGLVLVGAEWIANILNEPTVAATIAQYASPKVSGTLLIGSSVIVAACRQRKGSLDPVTTTPVTVPVTVEVAVTGPTGATGA